MSLNDRIQEDLKAALRAKDEVTKRTVRMLKSEIGKKELELGRSLDEGEELAVVTRSVKMRRDSISAYDEAGRTELADDERAEITVLERYLPQQLDADAARAAIEALAEKLGLSQKKDMGALMKAVMAEHRGQIDGKLASSLAAQILS